MQVAVASRFLVAASSDPGSYFIVSSQIVPVGYVQNFRQAA
jgi:hypothetical protein